MMMSSTLLNSTLFVVTSTATSEPANAYDDQGAAMYIAVILIWYSTGLALMLFLQIRPRSFQDQYVLDSSKIGQLASTKTNPFANYHNIQADNTKKQILNELKDPDRRQRLWRIYFASAEKQNEPHGQYYQTITADSATIGRINRKLADIHRMDTRDDDGFIPGVMANPTNENRAATTFDTTKFFTKRFTSFRRPETGAPSTRPPLLRTVSQPDAPIGFGPAENETLLDGRQATNGSRKRTSKFLNRFTVEKVPDNTRNIPILKENASE